MNTPRWVRTAVTYSIGIAVAFQGMSALLPSVTHAAAPTLRITEINWAGSASDSADQWIELQNIGASTITFTNANPYVLALGDAGSPSATISLDGTYPAVAAGEFLVITKEALATSSVKALVGSNYAVDATMNLPHTATEYRLYDDTAALIDGITDTDGAGPLLAPFRGSVGKHQSMSRRDAFADGSVGSNWYATITEGVGFDGLATQLGTPGETNTEVNPPSNAVPSPYYSTTVGTDISIVGTGPVGGKVWMHFALASHDPGPALTTFDFAQTITTSPYTLTAHGVKAGRYIITGQIEDVAGNRSEWVEIKSGLIAGEHDYVVVPVTSTVPTPTLDAVPALTNQPTVTLSGTLDSSATYDSVEIMRNGMYYATVPVSGTTFSMPVILLPNTSNNLAVMAVATNGTFSAPAAATVLSDSLAPNVVDSTKVVVFAAAPGSDDAIAGLPGAAEPGTTLYVYGDSAQTNLIGSETVALDGSFDPINIGDNAYATVYLVLQDAAGNRSAALAVANPIATLATGIAPTVVSVTSSEATISWTSVATAVKYRVKYRTSTGTFGSTMDVCLTGNASCSFQTTINGLVADTDYVFAIAAVDQYGNESTYATVPFHTVQAPVVTPPVAAATTPTPTVKKAVASKTPAATASPTPTAVPSDSPTADAGDVKSAATGAPNWTPWIVLAVLLAIAVLAAVGYFYWFGGEAGEAALASVLADRAKEEEAGAGKTTKTDKSSPPKKDNTRRW